jgi:hypothetical protein
VVVFAFAARNITSPIMPMPSSQAQTLLSHGEFLRSSIFPRRCPSATDFPLACVYVVDSPRCKTLGAFMHLFLATIPISVLAGAGSATALDWTGWSIGISGGGATRELSADRRPIDNRHPLIVGARWRVLAARTGGRCRRPSRRQAMGGRAGCAPQRLRRPVGALPESGFPSHRAIAAAHFRDRAFRDPCIRPPLHPAVPPLFPAIPLASPCSLL